MDVAKSVWMNVDALLSKATTGEHALQFIGERCGPEVYFEHV